MLVLSKVKLIAFLLKVFSSIIKLILYPISESSIVLVPVTVKFLVPKDTSEGAKPVALICDPPS